MLSFFSKGFVFFLLGGDCLFSTFFFFQIRKMGFVFFFSEGFGCV